MRVSALYCLLPLCAGGCQIRGTIGSNASADAGNATMTAGSESGVDSGMLTDGERFDVAMPDLPAACEPPLLSSCDTADDDPWHALGLGCPGDAEVTGLYDGDPVAMTVHQGLLGTSGVYTPREGDKFVILSTGNARHLAMTPAELVAENPLCDPSLCPSGDLPGRDLHVLPDPIDVTPVSQLRTCAQDRTLVGMGDCSNTLWAQWTAGSGAFDYAEMRLSTVVPEKTFGLSYDFAFFSVEYPLFIDHQTEYNDMYVAWLESESWTGNISFDDRGAPISVQAAFMDFKDSPSLECPPPCRAPQLAGFAMEGHAGTRWLTTTAPVAEGETIELVFSLFDLSDGAVDSMVLLDNFRWNCEGAPPITTVE